MDNQFVRSRARARGDGYAIGDEYPIFFVAADRASAERIAPRPLNRLRVGMPRAPALSKSRFTYGRQCHKQLWWRCYDGKAPELVPDPAQRALFARGHRVGDLAQTYFPGGFLIPFDGRQKKKAVAATTQAIAEGHKIIYEAAFEFEGVFAAVDVLVCEQGAWTLVEVKSSTGVKEQYLADAAVQAWVVESSGIPLHAVEVMHLNRGCVYPDLSSLFVRADVTPEVRTLLPGIPGEVQAQKAMLDLPVPLVAPGAQCHRPYPCPFFLRCNDPLPSGHVRELYGLRETQAQEFLAAGFAMLRDLDPSMATERPIWSRQFAAACREEIVFSADFAATVPPLAGKIGYLDFETLAPAVPVWEGCSPYDSVPAQYSLHTRDGDRVEHYEFLATGPEDPRPEVARSLSEALAGCDVIYTYNASFEKRCLAELAASSVDTRDSLLAMQARVEDFLPLVRNHVYHPDFKGSFSLKTVLPVLVPDLDYSDLRVADGQLASAEIETLLLRPEDWPRWRQSRTRSELLAYCGRDTLALLRLHDWFLEKI